MRCDCSIIIIAVHDEGDDDDDDEAWHDNRYGTATLALGKPNLEKATLN